MSRPATPSAAVLTLATVILAACASAAVLLAAAAPSSRAADSAVSIVDFAFEPDTVSIAAGDTVTWTVTRAREPHTVTPTDPADAFAGSGLLRQGDTFSATFAQSGTYRYVCSIHPEDMQGTIVVTAVATATLGATPTVASPSPTASLSPTPVAPTPSPAPSPSPSTDGSGDSIPLLALGLVLLVGGAVAVGLLVARSRGMRA